MARGKGKGKPGKGPTTDQHQASQQNPPPAPTALTSADAIDQTNEPAERNGPTSEARHGEARRWDWDKVAAIADIGLTAAIAIFTGVQVWVMNVQNGIMTRQGRQTDAIIEQMKADQRPWVGIKGASIRDMGDGKRPMCSVTIENSGRTPAVYGTMRQEIFIKRTGQDIDEEINKVDVFDPTKPQGIPADAILLPSPGMAVPPGAMRETALNPGPVITGPDMADIKSGNARLYVAIGIYYRSSATGEEHGTICCFSYDFTRQALVIEAKYDDMW